MGKTLSDDDPDAPKASKKAWDSNAITPGTPFMDLLSASLRYWVAQKMNQDAGWQDVSDPCFICFATNLNETTDSGHNIRLVRAW